MDKDNNNNDSDDMFDYTDADAEIDALEEDRELLLALEEEEVAEDPDQWRDGVMLGYRKIRSLPDLMVIEIPDEDGATGWSTFYQSLYRITCRVIAYGLEDELTKEKANDKQYMTRFCSRMDAFIKSTYSFMIEHTDEMKTYKSRIGQGKWSLYTCFYKGVSNLMVIKRAAIQRLYWIIQGEKLNNKKIQQRSVTDAEEEAEVVQYMLTYGQDRDEDCILLYANKKFDTLTQMQMWKQLLLLRHRWYELRFSPKFTELMLDHLEYYCALLTLRCDDNKTIIDGKEGDYTMVVSEPKTGAQFYTCSPTFVDNIACIFRAMRSSILIRKTIYDNNIVKRHHQNNPDADRSSHIVTPTEVAKVLYKGQRHRLRNICDKLMSWVESESQIIGDDTFKDKMRVACVNVLLRPAELDIFVRDGGGVIPLNATYVLEKSRPSLQIGWWMSKSVTRGIGVIPRDYKESVRAILTSLIFNAYCESHPAMRFPWGQECIVLEKSFWIRWDSVLTSEEPIILKYMAMYAIYYKGSVWEIESGIEEAIVVWIDLLIRCHTDKASVADYIPSQLDLDDYDNNNNIAHGVNIVVPTEFKGEKESWDIEPLFKFISDYVLSMTEASLLTTSRVTKKKDTPETRAPVIPPKNDIFIDIPIDIGLE
jgi:hypothetical protein